LAKAGLATVNNFSYKLARSSQSGISNENREQVTVWNVVLSDFQTSVENRVSAS
jgi:hypothetical protein